MLPFFMTRCGKGDMKILETERLILRQFSMNDASFVLQLLNSPPWLEFIGDRGVRTIDDAGQYIAARLIQSYERFGFGLYLIVLKPGGIPIGACGILKREQLADADIGFALLPEYSGKGYAFEAASATVIYARTVLHLPRLAAITMVTNGTSIRLLTKLGLRFERMIKLDDELALFSIDLKKNAL